MTAKPIKVRSVLKLTANNRGALNTSKMPMARKSLRNSHNPVEVAQLLLGLMDKISMLISKCKYALLRVSVLLIPHFCSFSHRYNIFL